MAADTTVYIKKVETPEARELAELHLLKVDLDHAHRALELAFNMPEQGEDGHVVVLSLLRDAIVQFCACFGKSEPYKLDKNEVFKGRDNWEMAFDAILDKRDTFAAHRFGPDRQCDILAGFLAGSTPQAGYINLVWTGFTPEQAPNVLLLVAIAREYVEGKIAAQTAVVNQQLAGMTQEELIALPDNLVTAPGLLRQSRERHRKSTAPKP